MPQYQTNSVLASLDVNGVAATQYAPAVVNTAVGAPNTITFFSFLQGNAWDLGYGVAPLIPRNAGALVSSDGQIVNLDLTDPTLSTWFGATFTNSPPFQNFNMNFSFPFAVSLSGQLAVIAPNLSDGIALSQGVRIVIL